MGASRDIANLGDAVSGNANVNFDANTLFIDGVNNRVGIGTNTPTAPLHIRGTAGGVGERVMLLTANSTYNGMSIQSSLANSTTTSAAFIDVVNELGAIVSSVISEIATDGSSNWHWATQSAGTRTDRRVERMRIDSNGSVTMPSQPALRLDGNNGNGFDFAGSTQLLVSTYYSSSLSRGNLSWNSSTGRVTATTPGYYCIMFQVYVQITGNANGRISIRKNGSTFQLMHTGLVEEGTYDLSTIVQLAANDYIEVVVDGFNTIRLYMGKSHTSFHMFLIG